MTPKTAFKSIRRRRVRGSSSRPYAPRREIYPPPPQGPKIAPMSPSTGRAAPVLVFGFGTTATMWAIGYVSRLPLVMAPSPVVAVLLGLCLPVGGLIGARETRRMTDGILIGLLSSALNLLILGAFLSSPTEADTFTRSPVVWVPVFLGLGAVLGGLGGLLGSRMPPPKIENHAWAGRLAVVAAAATLLLVVAGGLVTGEEAGMDVPDWPSSFGYNMFFYPVSRMSGGIYYEHAHRLFGTLVGLTCLVLAVMVLRRDESITAKRLAAIVFGLVCVQGILGGLRVTEDSRGLAVFHAVLGQLIFGLLVVLAAMTSKLWRGPEPPKETSRATTERKITRVFFLVVVVQILLGAVVRQLDWGLHIHITGAVAIFIFGLVVGFRLWGLYPEIDSLRQTGWGLLVLTILQVGLGLAALVVAGATTGMDTRPPSDVLITTIHQATGALLLGAAALGAAFSVRLLREPGSAVADGEPGGGED